MKKIEKSLGEDYHVEIFSILFILGRRLMNRILGMAIGIPCGSAIGNSELRKKTKKRIR